MLFNMIFFFKFLFATPELYYCMFSLNCPHGGTLLNINLKQHHQHQQVNHAPNQQPQHSFLSQPCSSNGPNSTPLYPCPDCPTFDNYSLVSGSRNGSELFENQVKSSSGQLLSGLRLPDTLLALKIFVLFLGQFCCARSGFRLCAWRALGCSGGRLLGISTF